MECRVVIKKGQKEEVYITRSGRLIYDLFKEKGVSFSFPCAGRGVCGGCKIRFLQNPPRPSAKDMTRLSKKELSAGVRLACSCVINSDCMIEIDDEKLDIAIKNFSAFNTIYAEKLNSEKNNKCVNSKIYENSIKENIVGDSQNKIVENPNCKFQNEDLKNNPKRIGIAIDLGTTTIAAAAVDLESGDILSSHTVMNNQRVYGADVISRIKASKEHGRELQENVIKDICTLIEVIVNDIKKANKESIDIENKAKANAESIDIENKAKANVESIDTKKCERSAESIVKGNLENQIPGTAKIEEIVVAGNTTQGYLLRGLDANSLGVYPYKAEHIGFYSEIFGDVLNKTYLNNQKYCKDINVKVKTPSNSLINIDNNSSNLFDENIFKALYSVRLSIFPSFTAFVGGDIVSGIFANDLLAKAKPFVMLDLGTNGEIVAFDGEKLFVTSTAAGPVFEAGGIRCGMAGVRGAINHIDADSSKEKLRVHTISGAEPIGICSSGIIEIIDFLVGSKIIDEAGTFTDEYFESGYPIYQKDDIDIRFYQEDVRLFQMGKAAIYTGLLYAISKIDADFDDIDFYIAGSFGSNLNLQKLANTYIFPNKILNKIKIIGNSSLDGCIKFLRMLKENDYNELVNKVNIIKSNFNEIELANKEGFEDTYIKALEFRDI